MKELKLLAIFLLFSHLTFAQEIPVRWDELTASDWEAALEKSGKTCILPFGILEKHGLHSPLGTDMIIARELSERAAQKEYAVVFPDYFYGQVYEAKQQPGTFALPSELVWDLLQATVEEIARNGFEKIVIVNRHGGNPSLIRYFVQSQLEEEKDYAVYFYDPATDPAYAKELAKRRVTDPAGDMHGGETETAMMLYLEPELMQLERAPGESGADLNRLSLPNLYTGIWWYAKFPNHYAGQAEKATAELGEFIMENQIETLARALKTVKEDQQTLKIQKEYFERVDQLLENK